jgi:hypothetical protein
MSFESTTHNAIENLNTLKLLLSPFWYYAYMPVNLLMNSSYI